PVEIRKLLYTANIIESIDSKLRKTTDGRRTFPSDESMFWLFMFVSNLVDLSYSSLDLEIDLALYLDKA
ncbi:transposase, partial [Persephonella sp.]